MLDLYSPASLYQWEIGETKKGVYIEGLTELIQQGINGEGNFIKACMPLIGVPCGPDRPPHRAPPAWFSERVRAALESVGELELATDRNKQLEKA